MFIFAAAHKIGALALNSEVLARVVYSAALLHRMLRGVLILQNFVLGTLELFAPRRVRVVVRGALVDRCILATLETHVVQLITPVPFPTGLKSLRCINKLGYSAAGREDMVGTNLCSPQCSVHPCIST